MMSGEEMFMNLKVAAIVPAAGNGERMGSVIPKQYLKICGSPLVAHCLRALSNHSWIYKVVVVADDIETMKKALSEENLNKISIVEGKGSRHRSIMKGLIYLIKDSPDIVVVHDGVRPIVPSDILTQVVAKSVEKGAAGVTCPLVSTLLIPDKESLLQESLQRDKYKNSEMPQSFNFKMILGAYQRCPENELDTGTECLLLALKYGGTQAYLVQGTPELWKVTYPRDMELANILLPKHVQNVGILNLKCPLSMHDDSNVAKMENEFCKLFNLKLLSPLSHMENCSYKLLCKETQETITKMLLPITSKGYSETVVLDFKLTKPVYLSVLVVICCIKGITDIENIFTHHGIFDKQATTGSIIFLFNTKFIEDVASQTCSLRYLARNAFSVNKNISVIICDSSHSDHHASDSHNTTAQMQNILEVCLSKYKDNLNRQILFC